MLKINRVSRGELMWLLVQATQKGYIWMRKAQKKEKLISRKIGK